jgi:hypothetical protein
MQLIAQTLNSIKNRKSVQKITIKNEYLERIIHYALKALQSGLPIFNRNLIVSFFLIREN